MNYVINYHPGQEVNAKQRHTLILTAPTGSRRQGVISRIDAEYLLADCRNRAMFEARLVSTNEAPTCRVSMDRFCVGIKPIKTEAQQ